MKYRYTNENIQKQIVLYERYFCVSIVMILLALFLISLSVFLTYRDIYTVRKIDPDNIASGDDTVYTYEITELPVEIYKGCYAVRTGGEVILMKYLKDEINVLNRDGSVRARGYVRHNNSDTDMYAAAVQYFTRHRIYSEEDSRKYSGFYLACMDIDISEKLREDHPIGLVFGITLLILWAVWEMGSRSFNAVKNLRPACGKVRFSHEEIDAMANHPQSEWIAENEVYITRDVIIGMNRGLAAVEYSDIRKIYVKKHWHFESKGPGRRSGKEYYTYKVIAQTQDNKRVAICENEDISAKLRSVIKKKCGLDIPTD